MWVNEYSLVAFYSKNKTVSGKKIFCERAFLCLFDCTILLLIYFEPMEDLTKLDENNKIALK